MASRHWGRRSMLDDSAAVGSDFAPSGGRPAEDRGDEFDATDVPEPYGDHRFATQPRAPELLGSPQRSAAVEAGRSLAQLPVAGSKRGRVNSPPRKPRRYYPSSAPEKSSEKRSRNYVQGGSSQRDRRDEYEDDGESDESGDAPGFSHAAVDADRERSVEGQYRNRGLRIASGLRRNPATLPQEDLFDFYMRYLVAGLVLPDGGARVVHGMPGSPDAHLWAEVSRRVEGELASLANGFAASTAWSAGARAAIDILPFFEFEEAAGGKDGCEICRRTNHASSFVVRLHGPVVNSTGLTAFGMTAAIDWAAGSSPVAAAAAPLALKTFWADHIPRGSHAVYSQEFRSGSYCRQRVQAYCALRHFKYRLLCAISAWLRVELRWPAAPTGYRPRDEPPPWHSGLLQSHVQDRQGRTGGRAGASSEYDYLGEEEDQGVLAGAGVFEVNAIRVAIDFLDGRRAYRRHFPHGGDGFAAFPGGHETKAIVALNSKKLKVTRFLRKLRGEAFWRQFSDVGPVIGREIADFFAENDLTDAFAEGKNCANLYGQEGRKPNWRRVAGSYVHTPNAVSRLATAWDRGGARDASDSREDGGSSSAPSEAGSASCDGDGSVRDGANNDDETIDEVAPSVLSFAFSSARRRFLESLPRILRVLAQDRFLALGVIHPPDGPGDGGSEASGGAHDLADSRARDPIDLGSGEDNDEDKEELFGRPRQTIDLATAPAVIELSSSSSSGDDSASPLAVKARFSHGRMPLAATAVSPAPLAHNDSSDEDALLGSLRMPGSGPACSAAADVKAAAVIALDGRSSDDESVPLPASLPAGIRGSSPLATPPPIARQREIRAASDHVSSPAHRLPQAGRRREVSGQVEGGPSDDDVPLGSLSTPTAAVAAAAASGIPVSAKAMIDDRSSSNGAHQREIRALSDHVSSPAHRLPQAGRRREVSGQVEGGPSDDDVPLGSLSTPTAAAAAAASGILVSAKPMIDDHSSSDDDGVHLGALRPGADSGNPSARGAPSASAPAASPTFVHRQSAALVRSAMHPLHADARCPSDEDVPLGSLRSSGCLAAGLHSGYTSDESDALVSPATSRQNRAHGAAVYETHVASAKASPASPRRWNLRALGNATSPLIRAPGSTMPRTPVASTNSGVGAPSPSGQSAKLGGLRGAGAARLDGVSPLGMRSGRPRLASSRGAPASAAALPAAARPPKAASVMSPAILAALADEQPLAAAESLPHSPNWRRDVLPLFQSDSWKAFVQRHCSRFDSLRSYAGIFASGDDAKARRDGAASAAADADLSFLANPPGADGTEVLVLTRSQRRHLIVGAADRCRAAGPKAAAMAASGDASDSASSVDTGEDDDEGSTSDSEEGSTSDEVDDDDLEDSGDGGDDGEESDEPEDEGGDAGSKGVSESEAGSVDLRRRGRR